MNKQKHSWLLFNQMAYWTHHNLHIGGWWDHFSSQFVVSVEKFLSLGFCERILTIHVPHQKNSAESQKEQRGATHLVESSSSGVVAVS